MDPISIPASVVAIGGASIGIATALKSVYKDFRDAPSQILHAQRQGLQVQTNHKQLNGLPQHLREAIQPANSTIKDVSSALSCGLISRRKRDRLKWAMSGKGKANPEISRLKEAESSAILTLSVAAFKEVEGVNPELAAIHTAINAHHDITNSRLDGIESNQDEIEAGIQILQKFACFHNSPTSGEEQNQSPAVQICRWNWLLGMSFHKIVSMNTRKSDRNLREWLIKWRLGLPLSWGYILTGRMRILGTRPTLCVLCLRQQNRIPYDSVIIEACKIGDVSTVKELLARGNAHPNDTTLDNLTLLRYSVRAGNPALVELLLNAGADPNLTFGTWETPLNNAFLFGSVDIIRRLIAAGADLDYVNSRGWTSLSYLWDPELKNHATTGEILDICFQREFSDWDYKDTQGCGPVHRAAAFGLGRDIRNLMCRGASMDLCTTDRRWTPIYFAVMHGNESTFEVLAQHIHPIKLAQMQDSAGWGLLHLAAEQGSEKMMFKLLELGADPGAFTIPASIAVPKGLEYMELRAETIADHCGHRRAYENAMKAVFSTSVNTALVEVPGD